MRVYPVRAPVRGVAVTLRQPEQMVAVPGYPGDFFNCSADLDFEDSVGDWLLFPFSLPEEAVHLDAKNLVG